MRMLYLIRHAKSSWDHPGLRDFERPLNDRGHRDAPEMARLLRSKGIRPDLIVSSPARRALTTAQYFAQTFGIAEEDIVREEDIYEASTSDILRIIRALPDEVHTVFLFGHNPTFTDVVNQFSQTYIANIPTCGIAELAASVERWADVRQENTRLIQCFFPKDVL
ncbi:MAG: histidine phosphatase family protein [Saprospiraceae bacterium]|nr:histidine phosphatase family protein [Saprospiraceae bacterium]MDW8229806.1 histidine phosphatase family protein [Saprospiraceae bacterium]